MLIPELFTRFSNAVSLSQSRRAAGFLPFAFAFAGGLALLARSVWVLPFALAAGIVLERQWPGDFAYGLHDGGPGAVTWFALVGGAIALVVGIVAARNRPKERYGLGALAALLFVLPVAVHGFRQWTPLNKTDSHALSPQLLAEVQKLPKGAVVIADPETSYRIAAAAPVYLVAAPDRPRREHEGERPRHSGGRRRAVARHRRPGDPAQVRCGLGRRARPPCPPPVMKVLLVTLYFPPAGGGGVQRPLKLATHLPELGIETHVLAPDDPKWIHRDDELPPPTLAWVHRVRFIGPEGRKPAEELHGTAGLERYTKQASLFGRRLLLPDENVTYNLTAIPAAIRIAREEGIDVVITTSPPPSVHFVGAAVKRATGARWIADLRDSLVAHPHRDAAKLSVRIKEQGVQAVASLVARQADAIVAVSDAIAEEMRTRSPRGPVVTIANGSDFEDFAGLEYNRGERFRITHAGSFFGKRDPRPFLTALARVDGVTARFVGDFRAADREWASAIMDRIELIPYAPHRKCTRAPARL